MRNGRRAMIGLCECCGTKMSVAGKWDGDVAEARSERAGAGREGASKQRTGAGV